MKEKIKQADLRQCTQKKQSLITVKELCASIPAARTTFYTYYDDLDQVHHEIVDELLLGLKETAHFS